MKYVVALVLSVVAFSATGRDTGQRATFVYVDKSSREIFFYSGKELIAKYRIALGRSPTGPKRIEGDKKTPEGDYWLDYKNPQSQFYRSIHVSYPNRQDKKQAAALGASAGGDIMIHGQPNNSTYSATVLQRYDWTDGCIALTNEEMDAAWEMIDVPVRIRIAP